jgi:hypothetical protein
MGINVIHVIVQEWKVIQSSMIGQTIGFLVCQTMLFSMNEFPFESSMNEGDQNKFTFS